MQRVLTSLLVLSALSSAAAAHPGEHGRMSLVEVITHYAEPDHLAFLALTVIVGYVSYRLGRRTEARVTVNAKQSEGAHDPR
mgnify:CR=1 FL=1